jgi:hypothetical protein
VGQRDAKTNCSISGSHLNLLKQNVELKMHFDQADAGGLVPSRPCNSLPGLKRTAFPGGMLTSSPVRGLRPMPVLRGFTLKTPKRRNSMRCPRPKAVLRDSNTVSTACSALVRLILVLVTTALTMSNLIKRNLPGAWADARGCGSGCQDAEAYTTLTFLCDERFNFFAGMKANFYRELFQEEVNVG